jgi:hypothetical protein
MKASLQIFLVGGHMNIHEKICPAAFLRQGFFDLPDSEKK